MYLFIFLKKNDLCVGADSEKRVLFNENSIIIYIMKKLTFISCLLLSGCLAGAMAANKKRKVSWFYELTFAFPMAVSMSVAALIFKLMLNPQIGIVNHIFGLDVQWFNGEKTALLSVIILGVWLGLGMDFLYLLSAVRSVPDDLIEAARIDGCPQLEADVQDLSADHVAHSILPHLHQSRHGYDDVWPGHGADKGWP